MSEIKLRTKSEYFAAIEAIRNEVKRLDKAPISSPSQAKDVATRMAALTRQADSMERAAYTDGTVKLEWQQAELDREQERDRNRWQAAMAVDRKVNPQNYVDSNTAREYLNNAVDLFSGLDDMAKVELISRLLSGQGGKDVDGNLFIGYQGGRATLHNDASGQFVSFVKEGAE